MSTRPATLAQLMEQAIDACIAHVEAGGIPFVGVVVDSDGRPASRFGVNLVEETGDPTAHAEVVAMRDAVSHHGLDALGNYTLLATGEPCGMCYRYAIDHGIERIYVAVDRDEVADLGFDYRASYPAFDITDGERDRLFLPLGAARRTEPFTRHLHLTGHALARRNISPKGA